MDWDDPEIGEFYDWDGQRITMHDWARLWQQDRRVALDHVRHRRLMRRAEVATVSTVWIGIPHLSWNPNTHLIFESMVFPTVGFRAWQDYTHRYSTRVQAEVGHRRIVMNLRLGLSPDDLLPDLE